MAATEVHRMAGLHMVALAVAEEIKHPRHREVYMARVGALYLRTQLPLEPCQSAQLIGELTDLIVAGVFLLQK